MEMPELDKKLLAGIRSTTKPLVKSDFERVRKLTSKKISKLEQRHRREIFVE